MKFKLAILLLCSLFFLTMCTPPVIPPPVPIVVIDNGADDYLPLAVGNSWEYSVEETVTLTTPNGTTTNVNSWGETWNVVSRQKVNDTLEIFQIEKSKQSIRQAVSNNGKVITPSIQPPSWSLDSMTVHRGKLSLTHEPFVRTGTTATTLAEWRTTTPNSSRKTWQVYEKKKGMISQLEEINAHHLAGLQGFYVIRKRLTNFKVSP